jgi:hypothetical protein
MNESDAPKIDSRAGFEAALHWGFAQAIEADARRIVAVDRDFADWPLGDPALLDRLTAWVRLPQRQLVLLGSDWDEVPRRHARFMPWRRTWAHAIVAWQRPDDLDVELPTLLLDDGPLLVRLFDRERWRGRAELDARQARLVRDEIDAVLQRSTPALPATQLGL